MAWRINKNKNFPRPVSWTEPNGRTITARNIGELFRSLRAIRERDGGDLEPGWMLRFQDELCSIPGNETLCLQVDDRESDVENIRHVNRDDVTRFLGTLRHFIANGGQLVDRAKAERRAAICASCPRNVPIKGCMGCSGLIPKIMKLTQGAKTTLDNKLMGCAVCGCQLKAKVHMPNEVIESDDTGGLEFPEWCWMHRD